MNWDDLQQVRYCQMSNHPRSAVCTEPEVFKPEARFRPSSGTSDPVGKLRSVWCRSGSGDPGALIGWSGVRAPVDWLVWPDPTGPERVRWNHGVLLDVWVDVKKSRRQLLSSTRRREQNQNQPGSDNTCRASGPNCGHVSSELDGDAQTAAEKNWGGRSESKSDRTGLQNWPQGSDPSDPVLISWLVLFDQQQLWVCLGRAWTSGSVRLLLFNWTFDPFPKFWKSARCLAAGQQLSATQTEETKLTNVSLRDRFLRARDPVWVDTGFGLNHRVRTTTRFYPTVWTCFIKTRQNGFSLFKLETFPTSYKS